MSAPPIGIDLGTTYSCVGVFEPNGRFSQVQIIANDRSNRTTPSFVAFNDIERLIGEGAKEQVAVNPTNTVFEAKRLIGRRYDEPTVQEDMKTWPFTLYNDAGRPKIEVQYKGETKRFYPEEISAMVLTRMKEMAEAFLDQTVTQAVITIPSYFNDSQRQATKDAAEIAGLKVLGIINEPTAAAIAYGFHKKTSIGKNILIFDLGGGTFDVSIVTFAEDKLEVKATAGDTHLGGGDFDSRMVNHFVQEFKRKHKKALSGNKSALQRLRIACELAKRSLSTDKEASINVECLYESINFSSKITRARFEDLCADLFVLTLEPVEKCLSDSKLKKTDINEIILVGGSSRIPKIQKLLKEYFNGKELNQNINPDEAVAFGAAIHAAILSGNRSQAIQDLFVKDVAPLSLGVDVKGGLMSVIIDRNTPIPVEESKYFTTSDDDQTSVRLKIYEGERSMSKDNNLLGQFQLGGILPAPRDVPQILVTFKIDANGILDVSAKDEDTGEQNQITITNDKGRLSKAEIARMVREARRYGDEDKRQREKAEARNNLEEYVNDVKSSIKRGNSMSKFSDEHRDKINQKLEENRKWLEACTIAEKEEFDQKRKDLEDVYDSTG